MATTTKLELVNRILDSAREQRIQSTTQPLGDIALSCIEAALVDVCTYANWIDTRTTGVATWVGGVATLATTTDYRITAVRQENSAGTQSVYAGYINKDDFDSRTNSGYLANDDTPQYWAYYLTSNSVRVLPYPSEAAGIAKVFFDTQFTPSLPATDATAFAVPERFLGLVEMRASSLFCLKYLGDYKLYEIFDREYERAKEDLLASQQGQRAYVEDAQPIFQNPILHQLRKSEHPSK